MWKLTQSQDLFLSTVSCKLRGQTSNRAKDDSGVIGRTTAMKPVRRRRQKNRFPSAWLVLGRDTRGSSKRFKLENQILEKKICMNMNYNYPTSLCRGIFDQMCKFLVEKKIFFTIFT